MAWYLGKVCDLYKGDGSAMDSGVVSVAVRRFMNYGGEQRLENRRGRGAGVACIPSAGLLCRGEWQVVEHGDMQWLSLSLERFTHFESFIRGEGDPECQKYGEKSKNFLFRVYLTE